MVCVSVCLSAGQNPEPCKTAAPIVVPFWTWTQCKSQRTTFWRRPHPSGKEQFWRISSNFSRPNLNYREHPVRVDILNLIRLRRQQRCELSLSALQQLVYYVCGRLGWPVCSLDRVVCHEVITSLFCFLNCLSGGCSTSPVHAPVSLLYQYIITRSHRMHAAYIVTHVPRLVICAFACIGHT